MDITIYRSEVEGVATPPPSKSYTHRAFLSSALSRHSEIFNPLIAEDTLATLRCCKGIGARFFRHRCFEFFGCDEIKSGYFYVSNSGTTLRLFMGILSLSKGVSVLDGDESIRRRPNLELAKALIKLGAKVKGFRDFSAPIIVGGILKGGCVKIRAISSQFVSALLFSLPLAKFDSELRVIDVKSKPYIDVTLHVLEESGIKLEREGNTFYIECEQEFRLRRFDVPADFSSASYLIASGVLAGRVELRGVYDSRQGDKAIVDIVRSMGGEVRWKKEDGVLIAEKSELEGIEVDAGDTPDLVPTIAVLGAVAKGRTVIYNAEHLRYKETNRIETTYRNLKALGVEVEKRRDGLVIKGGNIRGGVVDSYGDHRIAMAFAVLGLVADKVTVKNAEVVSVSFPNFFDVLKDLGAKVEIV
ncbi:3-phosphoshikimate 1-carboxyvinyltransferase [Archaeoglobus profundus]|uniref:3-phosphoshikimate 1-carboxyvinyltransferase n=1 Tax=Archaeoglobus profundus (strain DSM 5631 / JCM 9629 / NBRC 100127 / Av18) TaxID=572546 RepID=D2RI61_ARCPA|nr:3-phosphoshikimate 1-carboxyvinyltransferase [Archaeoglobus profundus]ADB57986.1 3-phosphoshikimate 1-carboxyvinyltransferase [Archaeoglobus profundus DSM 5631]